MKGDFACAKCIGNMNVFPTKVWGHQATASLPNLPNLDPKEQHSLLIYSHSRVGKQQHNNTPQLQRIVQKHEKEEMLHLWRSPGGPEASLFTIKMSNTFRLAWAEQNK